MSWAVWLNDQLAGTCRQWSSSTHTAPNPSTHLQPKTHLLFHSIRCPVPASGSSQPSCRRQWWGLAPLNIPGEVLWVAGDISLLPAQEILPRGRQNSSMMRDAGIMDVLLFLPVLLSTRHCKPWTIELVWWPVQFAAGTAYINNAAVCAQDWPAPSQGQGPLTTCCEVAQMYEHQNRIACHWASEQKME